MNFLRYAKDLAVKMCGIFGIVRKGSIKENIIRTNKAMSAMSHRGPDGEGLFFDQSNGIVLCHHRLAIIDPEHGKQPMSIQNGDLTIVFNGAIYNYLELRRILITKGHTIQSFCDTEVILYAYLEWGKQCVQHFIGMFSFAIWDKKNNCLFCARDRIGIKPFYYSFNKKEFIFSSEIKAILASGLIEAEPNYSGLQDYFTFQFCLEEKTLFKNIFKLAPGHVMSLQLLGETYKLDISQYWDVSYNIDTVHDESWFADNLSALIEDAIRLNLRSDVPLGAHLSGGLDSTAIVCLASNLLQEKLRTFTGAFPEGIQYDETSYAKSVANAVNAEYHDVYINGSEFPEILPRLMYYMDEPLAGPGLIPQYYVSKLASQYVKVVLGGQGGDELFIGYARYLIMYLEHYLSNAINETENDHCSLNSLIPGLPMLKSYKPMLQKLWRNGIFDAADARYFRLVDRRNETTQIYSPDILSSRYSSFETFQKIFNRPGNDSLINKMLYFDLKGSLPALLQVEDRMSMVSSLESRVPLLDHRIIEFMARVPTNIKFSGGQMKYLFKAAVKNTIPALIYNRKDKMGFPTPLTHWTKGVARDFVMDIVLSDRLRQRGIYNFSEIKNLVNNEQEYGREVWGILCLELWYRTFIDGDCHPNLAQKSGRFSDFNHCIEIEDRLECSYSQAEMEV